MHLLRFYWNRTNWPKVKKNANFGSKSTFGAFWAFRAPPTPPIKNLRGLLALFQFLLMYFTISSMTELTRFNKTGSRWRPGCQIGKNQNCSKWHLKNFTRISYIHFWKFHRFEPKETGWLKPSNINLVQLLLVANTTFIMIAPYFNPHTPQRTTPPELMRPATNHISYIYFWKFHTFEPMWAGWLNPSNMILVELIVDAIISFQPTIPPPAPPQTPKPSQASGTSWHCELSARWWMEQWSLLTPKYDKIIQFEPNFRYVLPF